jgi:two-component system, chemotaxis family, chemotaxis protein CheY
MRTCLVVDSSNVVRKVACRIFESMQFVTGEAETGPQAMEKCMAAMPDAILLDGHMPDVVVTEFLASLRALPNGSKPTILYCTTENDSSELARALSAGADEYVLKPLDRESIRLKLASAGLNA